MNDTLLRLDRRQAEQFLTRHLHALGDGKRSDFRFHRAVLRRFVAALCDGDDGATTGQLLLSDQRLLDWLIREARRRTTASAGCCFAAVSRYLRGLVETGLLPLNAMAAFQARHGGRGWPVLAGALQASDPQAALALLHPQPAKPGPIALHAAAYLELHQAIGKNFQPNKSLLTHLDRFLEAQGIQSPQAITPEVMEHWVNALTGNARTRFKKVRMAWSFLDYLLDLKVLSTNPSASVLCALGRLPKSTFKPFIFTQEQVASLLTATRQLPSNPQFPLRAETCSTLFALLYSLGLRMGEACRLRIEDVALAEGTLFINETKFYKSR